MNKKVPKGDIFPEVQVGNLCCSLGFLVQLGFHTDQQLQFPLYRSVGNNVVLLGTHIIS
jgi:hypothetical protein